MNKILPIWGAFVWPRSARGCSAVDARIARTQTLTDRNGRRFCCIKAMVHPQLAHVPYRWSETPLRRERWQLPQNRWVLDFSVVGQQKRLTEDHRELMIAFERQGQLARGRLGGGALNDAKVTARFHKNITASHMNAIRRTVARTTRNRLSGWQRSFRASSGSTRSRMDRGLSSKAASNDWRGPSHWSDLAGPVHRPGLRLQITFFRQLSAFPSTARQIRAAARWCRYQA